MNRQISIRYTQLVGSKFSRAFLSTTQILDIDADVTVDIDVCQCQCPFKCKCQGWCSSSEGLLLVVTNVWKTRVEVIFLTLKISSIQIDETSVTTSSSPSQDYTNPHDKPTINSATVMHLMQLMRSSIQPPLFLTSVRQLRCEV